MNEVQELRGTTAEIISLFAEVYQPPTREFWHYLVSGEFVDNINNRATYSKWGVRIPQSLEELQNLYIQTLSNQVETAAYPVESLYKQWTEDRTCTLPFSKSTGYLLGDSALHIRHILKEFEIEIPAEYASTPDHLTILLELLAYFIDNSSEEFVQQFIDDHFDWLEQFYKKLIEATGDKNVFYLQMTGLLMEILMDLRREK
ncbi:Nitrate reductase delta subunit [Mesobacillus persicus]|uniref:Nitrate reductase delta subunit n=1 Tax=Mesobacillus persicus TaxID=930146 RepID=A0A1H8EWF6_9BACI|nr:molecular chaperone TorD family protein [Mesobacillus persicus]SEN23803.1 Nitrate reductase delta subunit [Mesobacillus persicus]